MKWPNDKQYQAFVTIMEDPAIPDPNDPEYDEWLFQKAWEAAHNECIGAVIAVARPDQSPSLFFAAEEVSDEYIQLGTVNPVTIGRLTTALLMQEAGGGDPCKTREATPEEKAVFDNVMSGLTLVKKDPPE